MTKDKDDTVIELTCQFCGKPREDVDKLLVSGGQRICNECVELCVEALDLDITVAKKPKKITKTEIVLNPVKIKEYLDEYVIGQFDAKQAISVAVVNHFKRIQNPSDNLELEKSNVLIIGPSGSGKTLMAKTIAKLLDVPFVVADATTLTEAGYVGEDVESIISMLLTQADGDIEKAQHGIVFLDEIDKICRKGENVSITRDVSGEGVQQALLKIVEGTKCRIMPTAGRKHPNMEMLEVNTNNILFIASGAFVGLEKNIKDHIAPKTMGFGSDMKELDQKGLLDKVQPKDIVHYGLIPEFIGRFPVITTVEQLSKKDLVHILKETKNSIIDQMKYYFSLDNVELEFEDAALEAIAEKALALETGARGLKNIIEKSLLQFQFDLVTLKNAGAVKITITKDVINNKGDPAIIYNNGDIIEQQTSKKHTR